MPASRHFSRSPFIVWKNCAVCDRSSCLPPPRRCWPQKAARSFRPGNSSARLIRRLPEDQGSAVEERFTATVSSIVEQIATCPEGRLGFPCCLRVSPCPYRGCGDVERVLQDLIEEGIRGASFNRALHSRIGTQSLQHLLAAAAPYNYSGAERTGVATAILQLYLYGLLGRGKPG